MLMITSFANLAWRRHFVDYACSTRGVILTIQQHNQSDVSGWQMNREAERVRVELARFIRNPGDPRYPGG